MILGLGYFVHVINLALIQMTLETSVGMAEGKDPHESRGAMDSSATVNGHMSDDDHAAGSSDFAASILGHPSTILIVTNVADATFISTEAKVTVS